MTKKYIGTKIVTAFPQDKDSIPGYGVIYADGYTSWSPKEVFKEAFRAIEQEGQVLTFGDALAMLKLSKKVARAGWNGKGMFIFLVPSSVFSVSRPPLLGIYPEGTVIRYPAHVNIKTTNEMIIP